LALGISIPYAVDVRKGRRIPHPRHGKNWLRLLTPCRTISRLSELVHFSEEFAWNWLGLLIAITGGFMLFSSAATKYIPNPAFEIKLGILVPFGILWHVLVQGHARTKERSETVSGFGRFAGLFEFLIWFAVITAPSRFQITMRTSKAFRRT